ncbi:MAG TPA: HDOD domain-containing protein [Candidatus Aminicenantes bacterium]|nr:HDOD domain-containing protein [Candidatus Aminicenantes bacterium]
MDKHDTLVRLFSGEKQLPTLPVLFAEFTKLMEQPLASSKRVSELVMKDQAMVVKVLKLCNSALYSNRQEITNLTGAINFLGLSTLRNLILQISMVRLFSIDDEAIPEFRTTTFWEHSLATAYFTQFLAKRLQLPHNENYYIAGLTHDIGKLAMYQFYPERFFAAVKNQLEAGTPDTVAEQTVFGVDHADVGAFLAEKWRFKKEIGEAIQLHHSLSSPNIHLCTAVVRIANFFSKAAGICFPWDRRVIDIVGDPAWTILAAYQEWIDVEKLTFELYEETPKVTAMVTELLSRRG